MSGKLVVVFGGSGFIGRHLIRRLARRGYRVKAAVRKPYLAGFLKTQGAVGQVVPVQANLRYESTVLRAVEEADLVVNLVGVLYESGRQKFATVQAMGAKRVAEAARQAGAQRLVQISAIGADPHSQSLYARTKSMGEQAVLEVFPAATIMRPSIVFGPEDDFFNRFASLARFLPALPLIGGGHTRFQPVYVGDVADAIVKALEEREPIGKLYELGGPRIYTFKEILELILAETERKRLLVPVPFWLAMIQGFFLGLLPNPLLTMDQVRLLRRDNVVSGDYPGLADLGISPTAVEALVGSYLQRYRRTGQFRTGVT